MTRIFRLSGVLSMLTLTVLLCGFDTTQSCNTSNQQIGPSGGEVAAAVIGVGAVLVVGTVVLVEVHHSHHTVKGCAMMGPNGLEVQETSGKRWMLSGVTSNVKVGDQVKVHGSRVKKAKGSTADQTFLVEKLNKDYGVCKVSVAAGAAAM